ncbi:Ribosomal protein [Parasponia andersonii]|uniref:Ribosomal protein n=1 Tax=Parasponia andersonii TaxID=3476 RepID=A0A2P5BA09_PARAD|nr:Ribosomal protein [Parasponia andersonii]
MAAASSLTLSKLLTSLLSSPSPPPPPPPPPPPSSPPSTLISLPKSANFPKIASVRAPPPRMTTLGPTSPAISSASASASASSSGEIAAVVFPSVANSNTLFFKSAYNVQVITEENEPEERLLSRFRREVFKAGVLQECRRRRFFENSHDKRKRKARDAARKNRKRFPQSKAQTKAKQETTSPNGKKDAEEEDDNWDHFDVELPY